MSIALLEQVASKDKNRPQLARPMKWHRDAKLYTIATDGHRMVEVRGMCSPIPLADPPEGIIPAIKKYLASTPDDSVPFDFAALRDFIRATVKGQTRKREVRAFVGGTLFNAKLFYPMARYLSTDQPARWSQRSETAPALVDGGEWRFIVMPMLDYMSTEKRATIPRFEIEGAQFVATFT